MGQPFVARKKMGMPQVSICRKKSIFLTSMQVKQMQNIPLLAVQRDSYA